MRQFLLVFTGVVIVVVLLNLGANWQEKRDTVYQDNVPFMRAKMQYTNSIVEGLALENFPSISKNAQDLKLMSYESTWQVFQSPDYVALSRDFRESAGRLQAAAKSKNIDGAMLSYFEVTLNCVRCHKVVRQKRQVETDKASKNK